MLLWNTAEDDGKLTAELTDRTIAADRKIADRRRSQAISQTRGRPNTNRRTRRARAQKFQVPSLRRSIYCLLASPSPAVPWLRTNGVNTDGAAAKVINFDRLRKKYALALLET